MKNRDKKIKQIEDTLESNYSENGSFVDNQSDQAPKKGWVKRAWGAVKRAAREIDQGVTSLAEAQKNNPAMAAATSGSAFYAAQKAGWVDTPSIPKDTGASMAFTGVSAVTLGSYMEAEKKRQAPEPVAKKPEPKSEPKVESRSDGIESVEEILKASKPQTAASVRSAVEEKPAQEPKEGWVKKAFNAVRKAAKSIDQGVTELAEAQKNNPAMAAMTSGSAFYGAQKAGMVDTPSIPKDSARSLAFTGVSAVTLGSYLDEQKKKQEVSSPSNEKPGQSFLDRVKTEVKSDQDKTKSFDQPETNFNF